MGVARSGFLDRIWEPRQQILRMRPRSYLVDFVVGRNTHLSFPAASYDELNADIPTQLLSCFLSYYCGAFLLLVTEKLAEKRWFILPSHLTQPTIIHLELRAVLISGLPAAASTTVRATLSLRRCLASPNPFLCRSLKSACRFALGARRTTRRVNYVVFVMVILTYPGH